MIEIRTFDSDAGELARLTDEVWSEDYASKENLPAWDARFFDWQLLAERPGGRDYLVAAYDGTRLVGALLAEGFRFRLHGREVTGSMGSWLTVHPAYRKDGVGLRLLEELRKRHREREAAFCLGFIAGGRHGLAYRFWNACSLAFPDEITITGKVGLWVRMLDSHAVARWSVHRVERIGARVVGWFQRRPRPVSLQAIRAYRPDDLAACLNLTQGLAERVDLGYVWTGERLGLQLQYKEIPRTLVMEDGGAVRGFINYYRLDCRGRGTLAAALIDLVVVDQLTTRSAVRLLRAALAQMADEGIQMALALRTPAWSTSALWRTGFVPLPADTYLLYLRTAQTFSLSGIRSLHVQFR
jgi:GNAT superfamily N-acetyltransferase